MEAKRKAVDPFKLISMREFVLNETNAKIELQSLNIQTQDRLGTLRKIENYAKFLSQPLTLGMFVPCVNGEPFNYSKHGNQDDFDKAKSEVLFEGCTIEKKADWFIVKIGEMPIWVSWNSSKVVEDLLSFDSILLTPAAIKQIFN